MSAKLPEPARAVGPWPAPSAILVPRALVNYQCERTLMCCRMPFTAPVSPEDEARLREHLAQSEAGRAILPTLETTFELDGEERQFAKPYGSCLHLEEGEPRGCKLHHMAGLAALPSACRNFPRIVHAVGDRWEVAFTLACPTAARHLADDPDAYTHVEVPLERWPYPPHRRRDEVPERYVLRDRWLALFAAVREDAGRLMQAIGALLEAPSEPPSPDALPPIPAAVEAPCKTLPTLLLGDMLFLLPERGRTYQGERDALLRDLSIPWPTAKLVAASEARPDLVAAFIENQLQNLVLHSSVGVAEILRLTARRALMVIRVVECLCDRVPFRSRTLYADAYTALAQLDPDLAPHGPEPTAAEQARGVDQA